MQSRSRIKKPHGNEMYYHDGNCDLLTAVLTSFGLFGTSAARGSAQAMARHLAQPHAARRALAQQGLAACKRCSMRLLFCY
jgi:hypothetical protein